MKLLLLAALGAGLSFGQVFVPSDGSSVQTTLSKNNPMVSPCTNPAHLWLNYTTGHLWSCLGTPGTSTYQWTDQSTAAAKASLGAGVCGFGDSLIGAGSSDVYFAPTWFNVLVMLSNGAMQFVHQGGVSGNTTTQMRARLAADVLQQSCSKVVMDGGTNDISASVPLTTIQANLLYMYQTIRANGQLPIASTIPPHTGVFYAQTSALNAWIRGTAAKLNIPLVDVFAVAADPATGDYRSGYSADGLHPTNAAFRLIAARALADLASIFPAHHPILPATNTDPSNLLPNGLFLNSSAGIGTGWTAINSSGHVTYTVATDSNVAGNVQVFTKATTAVGDNDGLAAPNIDTGYAAGDRIAIVGKLVTSGLEAGLSTIPPAVNVYFYTSGYAYAGAFLAPWALWPCDIANGQIYLEAIVPAATAHISIQFNVGNGTGIFKVGQLGVYNLTALGL